MEEKRQSNVKYEKSSVQRATSEEISGSIHWSIIIYKSTLSNISSKYHKFANVFSKTKAETLSPYCSYDLKINLKEGA